MKMRSQPLPNRFCIGLKFTALALYVASIFASVAPASETSQILLTDLGDGVSLPFYGSENVLALFQDTGLTLSVDYFANPVNSPLTGIPSFNAGFSSAVVAAQVGAAAGSGYVQAAPAVGFQILPFQLRAGIATDLQFNSFQWNNLKAFVIKNFGDQWSLGARATVATVAPNLIDEVSVGMAKNWHWLQTVLDIHVDGTFGTIRLWPGLGITLGAFDLGASGDLARSSNWTFYADRLKLSGGVRLGKLAFARVYFETPSLFGIGLGLTL